MLTQENQPESLAAAVLALAALALPGACGRLVVASTAEEVSIREISAGDTISVGGTVSVGSRAVASLERPRIALAHPPSPLGSAMFGAKLALMAFRRWAKLSVPGDPGDSAGVTLDWSTDSHDAGAEAALVGDS